MCFDRERLTLVRLDDYEADSGTNIDIPIDVPSGVVVETSKVEFGMSQQDGTDTVNLTLGIVLVSDAYFARFEATSEALDVASGLYDYQAVLVEANGRRTTVSRGVVDMAEAQVN